MAGQRDSYSVFGGGLHRELGGDGQEQRRHPKDRSFELLSGQIQPTEPARAGSTPLTVAE
jgi:hypothetical protein